jgi:hypothetical protein
MDYGSFRIKGNIDYKIIDSLLTMKLREEEGRKEGLFIVKA